MSYSFDASGNLQTRSDAMTLTHDARQRLIQVVKSGTTSNYLQDPFGRRIKKTVASTTTWFLWDGSSLIGEFDASGIRTKRYPYLGRYAPAQVEDTNGVYYVHADHLDTPRFMTGSAGQIVWRSRREAYGKTTVEEDADSNGVAITLNIRFPGQYFDSETGLHYNYFRDYDPAIGRYVQSDPIGLKGGINTFAYAAQSPARYADPTGALPIAPGSSCWVLRANVILYCKILPRRCLDGDSCPVLRRKALLNQMCAFSQMELTRKCYPGEPTHYQVIEDALNGAKRCYERIDMKCWGSCPNPNL